MDDIDGTGHYERKTDLPAPSLLAVVLDTNPYAWAMLAPSLSLSTAVADLLVFINAHLAFNHANKVVAIASHCGRTAWLYPSPSSPPGLPLGTDTTATQGEPLSAAPSNPNKYRPFALIEHEFLRNLENLVSTSQAADVQASSTSTMLSGALTLALSYINKTQSNLSSASSASQTMPNSDTYRAGYQQSLKMTSRILVISASGDLASQYIPIMNLIFAAQHLCIPIDILKLAGDSVLLQQASYTTSGIFLSPPVLSPSNTLETSGCEDNSDIYRSRHSPEQRTIPKPNAKKISLLPTLLFAFLPDTTARQHLVLPTGVNVDFRAACFCHRRVVDIGFVCSICLSIFCEEGVALGIQSANSTSGASDNSPGGQLRGSSAVTKIKEDGACLTCGTILNLKVLNPHGGGREIETVEQSRIKKKKKKRRGGMETPPA